MRSGTSKSGELLSLDNTVHPERVYIERKKGVSCQLFKHRYHDSYSRPERA